MRHFVLLALLVSLPSFVLAREVKLDSSKRAQREGWSYHCAATRSQFQQMQRSYRPSAFGIWTGKLSLLRNGMKLDDVRKILNPREIITDRVITAAGRVDTIVLDDAYYTGVMVDPGTDQMIWVVQPPIPITYDIRQNPKKN